MLSVELGDRVFVEFGHLELIDLETPLLNGINDLAHLLIRIRLDHSEGGFSLNRLLLGSCDVPVFLHFKHSGEDCHLRSNK